MAGLRIRYTKHMTAANPGGYNFTRQEPDGTILDIDFLHAVGVDRVEVLTEEKYQQERRRAEEE